MIFDLLHSDIPALNGVTLRTVRAHPSLVHVGMTVLAILPDIRENRLHVALRALHFFMHTAQRIPGLVVIEFRVRLDRAPRAHLVTVVARDGERRPVRIPRGRLVVSMGMLGNLEGLCTRWRCTSHTVQGQQSPQDELEQCQRKFPFPRRVLDSPAGKEPLKCLKTGFPGWKGALTVPEKLPALCSDSRGQATVRTASSGPVGLSTLGANRQGSTSADSRPHSTGKNRVARMAQPTSRSGDYAWQPQP